MTITPLAKLVRNIKMPTTVFRWSNGFAWNSFEDSPQSLSQLLIQYGTPESMTLYTRNEDNNTLMEYTSTDMKWTETECHQCDLV